MEPTLPPAPPAGRPSPVLLVFLIVPVTGILIALMMVLSDTRSQQPPDLLAPDIAAASASLINYAAPDFTLSDMDGNTVKLSDYRGRVLFLNFWQTTCEPCVRELPALAEFAADQGDKGAAVLTINFEETSEQVNNFFAEYHISGVPVVLDPTSDVRRVYGVVAIPRTFIIDAQGIVRTMKIGEITVGDMETYLESVQTS